MGQSYSSAMSIIQEMIGSSQNRTSEQVSGSLRNDSALPMTSIRVVNDYAGNVSVVEVHMTLKCRNTKLWPILMGASQCLESVRQQTQQNKAKKKNTGKLGMCENFVC